MGAVAGAATAAAAAAVVGGQMASDVQVEEHGPKDPICLVVKQLELLKAMEGWVRDVYRRDMEANLRAMRRAEGGYSNVEAWDVPFYTLT